MLLSAGSVVFNARSLHKRNMRIPVVATDNDPCFSGIAYATLISKEDMKKTKACDRHKYEYVVRVSCIGAEVSHHRAALRLQCAVK
jgi:hypothetical protein